jgi:hypothetical protein
MQRRDIASSSLHPACIQQTAPTMKTTLKCEGDKREMETHQDSPRGCAPAFAKRLPAPLPRVRLRVLRGADDGTSIRSCTKWWR